MDKNKAKEYELFPIGCVKIENGKTYLHIFKAFVRALKQLEHFDHIRVFWWLNIADRSKSKEILQNRPPYKKAPVSGVFASRSSMRPNPIGLTTAKIIEIDQNKGIIEIDFIDADENTPILDIKAYIPIEDRIKDVIVPKWISNLPEWIPEDNSIKAFHPGRTHSENGKNLSSPKNLEPVNEKKAFYIFPIGCVKKENKKTYLNIHSPYIPALKRVGVLRACSGIMVV